MIHYHGTPVTPRRIFMELAGRNFCVSFSDPRDIELAHQIGQSVMIDNGAYSFWKAGERKRDWSDYYAFVEPWLEFHSTWCVIPDVIDGTEDDNEALIDEWNAVNGDYFNAAPVWHIHESLDRLRRLLSIYRRVCFGSSGEFMTVGSPRWNVRLIETFNYIIVQFGRIPSAIHMLRGMSLSGSIFPFASVDSTDIARNHEQKPGQALKMAQLWDVRQSPGKWIERPTQRELKVEVRN